MDPITALTRQFDPAHALEADEKDLYVDWQQQLGADDVKARLTHSIARDSGYAVQRLFTGHRGVGKTTELKRVQQQLQEGSKGRRLFVSLLEAEEWLDVNDVQPADILVQIIRQLVTDLKQVGYTAAEGRVERFASDLWETLNRDVEIDSFKLKPGWAELGVTLKQSPSARPALRKLLEDRLPTLYQLLNSEVLYAAKQWLRRPENGAYQDILVIVDQLDRTELRLIEDGRRTNHEHIFLDRADVLRSLECDILYTIPIELAYSHCRPRLSAVYSSDILTLPVVPVAQRTGEPDRQGIGALAAIVEKRARRAGLTLEQCFADRASLDRLCLVSGGYMRGLFLLIRSALDRTDELPLTAAVVERTIRRVAADTAQPLRARDWRLLLQAHATKRSPAEESPDWLMLLRNLYLFHYQDTDGADWYDWNPLLAEVPESSRPVGVA